MVDYKKEEKQFLQELNDGCFKIERIPNTETNYPGEKEARDVKVYGTYIKSDLFKDLDTGANK
jgi:hypothetical protein